MASVKTRNLDKWEAKVRRLPAAVKRRVSDALEKNSAEHAAAAERDVPVLSGRLKANIGNAKKDDEGLVWISFAGFRGKGQYGRGFYARLVEFGTEDTAAQPFFFPNYRALRPRFKSRLSRAVSAGVKDVAGG